MWTQVSQVPTLETSTIIKHASAKSNMPKFVPFYNAMMFQMKTQPAKNVTLKNNKETNSIFRLEFQWITSPSVNQLWSNDPREAPQTWTSFTLTSIICINLHSQDLSNSRVLSVEHLQEWHLPWQAELCPWKGHSDRLAFGNKCRVLVIQVMKSRERKDGVGEGRGWEGGRDSCLPFGLETGRGG